MEVRRIVIHQLEKEPGTREIKYYNTSKSLIPVDEGINAMCSLLHESFEKDRTRYAKFKVENVNNAVMKNINAYLADDDDEIYLKYSQISLGELAGDMKRETLATGGYYVFADYEISGNRFVAIIIVRKKDGFDFKWQDSAEVFNFLKGENINTDKIAMGFRMNCGLYDNHTSHERNYISLVTYQGTKLSDYFTTWVNVTDTVNAKVQSDILVVAIKGLGSPDEAESSVDFERRAHNAILTYKKANKGKVNIGVLSETLFGNASILSEYILNELEKEIDNEISVDPSSLKRLIQINAKVEGIDLTINANKIGREVRIDGDTLIIQNESIVRQIESQRPNPN